MANELAQVGRFCPNAARQAAEIEDALLKDYRISQAQIDGLWTYVAHKGHKGGAASKTTGANSGAVP